MDETSHQGSRRGGAGLTFQLEQVCCGNVIQRSSLKQGKHKPRARQIAEIIVYGVFKLRLQSATDKHSSLTTLVAVATAWLPS